MSALAVTVVRDGPWTIGVKVWLPLAALLVVLAVLVIVLSLKYVSWLDDQALPWQLPVACAVVVILVVTASTGAKMWPWHADYHQFTSVSGTVDRVTSRLLSAGDKGGTDQKFAVLFAGSDQPYGCNDTRCALLRHGDRAALLCKRSYEYASVSGWDCHWNGRQP